MLKPNLLLHIRSHHLVYVALLAILSLVPFTLEPFYTSFLIRLFLFAVLAESYNIVGGYMGYMNLGHSAPFGVAAYVFCLVFLGTRSFELSLVAASLAAIMFAAAIGVPLFRLKGAYFALASFALIWTLRLLVINLREITGGYEGIRIFSGYNLIPAYYMFLALTVFTIILNYKVRNSNFGLALLSIREDEEAAASLGINTFKYKVLALNLSSIPLGAAGGVYAWYMTAMDPDAAFGLSIALDPVIMAVLGGAGTIAGPLLGVVLLLTIEEVLWSMTAYLHLFMYGIIIAIIGLFMPGGILRTRGVQRTLCRVSILIGSLHRARSRSTTT